MPNSPKTIAVFAPHPDDETLACGGTVILETRKGNNVHIVIMTDGRNSHKTTPDTFPKPGQEEIARIRHNEALRAAKLLGVGGRGLTFLNFRDGTLKDNIPAAARKVGRVLAKIRPTDIYLPSAADAHRDHHAANAIVLAAASSLKLNADIYEYIIWTGDEKSGGTMTAPGKTPRNVTVDISSVLDEKLKAMDAYQSQIGKMLNSRPQMPVLNEQFVARFRQPVERFLRYKMADGKVNTK